MKSVISLILLLTSGHFQGVLPNDNNGMIDSVSENAFDKSGNLYSNWEVPSPDVIDGESDRAHSFDDLAGPGCCSSPRTSLKEDSKLVEKAKNGLDDHQQLLVGFLNFEKRKPFGQGKRKGKFDPALKFMGLGKRSPIYGRNSKPNFKRESSSNGVGRREGFYNPGLKYIGLGKRHDGYDPASPISDRLRKQSSSPLFYKSRNSWKYDPALKAMGLGKRILNKEGSTVFPKVSLQKFHPNMNILKLGSMARLRKFHFGRFTQGQGKRERMYDPALKYMGLGKRSYDSSQIQYSPSQKFQGNHQFIGSQFSEFNRKDDPILLNRRKRSTPFDVIRSYSNDSISEPEIRNSLDDISNFKSLELDSTMYDRSEMDLEPNASKASSPICSFKYPSSNHAREKDESKSLFPSRLNTNKRFFRSNIFANFGRRQSEGFTRYFEPKRTEFAPPEFDPGWKFIGLGKRPSDGNLLNPNYSTDGKSTPSRLYRSVSNSIGALIYKPAETFDSYPKTENIISGDEIILPAKGIHEESTPPVRGKGENDWKITTGPLSNAEWHYREVRR